MANFNPRTPCGVRPDGAGDGQGARYFNPRTPCGVRRLWFSYIRDMMIEFQSTHPLRGATFGLIHTAQKRHFNPRTPCGVRRRASREVDIRLNFNPRTPCGVRQGDQYVWSESGTISIHAPLAGCDRRCSQLRAKRVTFQSTHPLRGATGRSVGRAQGRNPFQSTHPLRGATLRDIRAVCAIQISIHAPLAGCDDSKCARNPIQSISIHAPLAGCDVRSIRCLEDGESNFNPRTPCGVRRAWRCEPTCARYFNPRTPCGVRPRLLDASL